MWLFVTSSQNVNVCSGAFVTVFVMCVPCERHWVMLVKTAVIHTKQNALNDKVYLLTDLTAFPTFTVYAKELTSQINIPATSHSLSGLTFDTWINICCCERCVSLRESFSGVRSPQILGSGSLGHFWCLFMLIIRHVYSP